MEQLLNILNLTQVEYETKVIDNYLVWCNLNAWDDNDCQKLLANTALFNWWYRQYQMLEVEFMEEVQTYSGITSDIAIRRYHTDKVINIAKVYSKPLLTAARNLKPVILQLN